MLQFPRPTRTEDDDKTAAPCSIGDGEATPGVHGAVLAATVVHKPSHVGNVSTSAISLGPANTYVTGTEFPKNGNLVYQPSYYVSIMQIFIRTCSNSSMFLHWLHGLADRLQTPLIFEQFLSIILSIIPWVTCVTFRVIG